MKITSDLTNLTTAILILTVQMFIEWTLVEILTNCQLKFLVSAYSNFFFSISRYKLTDVALNETTKRSRGKKNKSFLKSFRIFAKKKVVCVRILM
jgi:hypothetical protein